MRERCTTGGDVIFRFNGTLNFFHFLFQHIFFVAIFIRNSIVGTHNIIIVGVPYFFFVREEQSKMILQVETCKGLFCNIKILWLKL